MFKKYILIFLTFVCCLTSCDLEDDSQPETGTNTIIAKELLQNAMRQVAFNQSAIGGRSAAAIMQYLQENDGGALAYTEYFLGPNIFDNMWSAGFYSGSLASLQEMRAIATEVNEEDLIAISLILLAHEYGSLTNMFGDIPFTEALQGGSIVKPKFDSQEEVYEGIINILDEAITIIGSKTTNEDITNEDLIYQGNLQSWKKFAFGLKARFLFNQRNRNPNLDAEIVESLNSSFENSGEQAVFNYSPTFINPQNNFAISRPGTLRTGEHFLNQLVSTEDPRRSRLTTMENFNFWEYFIRDSFIPKWFEESAAIPILSYTELLFMRVELSLYMGADQNETSNLLNEAITLSLIDNDVNISNVELAFINTNSDLNGLDEEGKIQRIIEQAYVAYYGFNHLQAWNNYRRTGYPKLIPTTTDPNANNPSAIVPRRFVYPESEFEYNLDQVNDAISRQGGALLDDDIWIFE